ncbi:hypothetical protein [Brevundimonas sp. RM1]
MTTDALAPYALPLRREGDAAIVDATGETVLVIDPDRHLENDEDAARLADRVFAMLTAAPVREEGGAVETVWRCAMTVACNIAIDEQNRTNDDDGPSDVLNAQGEIIRRLKGVLEIDRNYRSEVEAILSYGAEPFITAPTSEPALATREEAPAETTDCKTCAGNGEIVTDWDEYLSPPKGAPADHATADCPDCDGIGKVEALAEAGEIDLYDDKVQAGIAWTMRQWGEALGLKTWTQGDGSESVEGDVGAEIHTILVDAGLRDPETNEMAALRAQPQAREEAQPVEKPAPFDQGGIGHAMYQAFHAYRADYVLSTDGADYEPTPFERDLIEDFFAGLMAEEAFFGPIRALYDTHPATDALREDAAAWTALADLVSWFTKPVQGQNGMVWVIPAGEQGADDAVASALAALQAEQKGGAS